MTVNPGNSDMTHPLSQEEAIARLRTLCEEAGGVGILADKIGVHISALSQQINGHRLINGKVAEFMGLELHKETTITYKRRP